MSCGGGEGRWLSVCVLYLHLLLALGAGVCVTWGSFPSSLGAVIMHAHGPPNQSPPKLRRTLQVEWTRGNASTTDLNHLHHANYLRLLPGQTMSIASFTMDEHDTARSGLLVVAPLPTYSIESFASFTCHAATPPTGAMSYFGPRRSSRTPASAAERLASLNSKAPCSEQDNRHSAAYSRGVAECL
ncbi:hypothetical protein CC78DRAFT_588256 [Lojkania enalia]|uniref:Uncharacterized protein n=1 Tax=Lojkania enalia TaxID=147567 RepID=A0A9P4JVC2_9PLEO|nr:hypothetical protein CC78DRAFT_588256 [Didymosphaeria enalia]